MTSAPVCEHNTAFWGLTGASIISCTEGNFLNANGIFFVLAHLGRMLIGELIVYTDIRRPSVCSPSTFSNDISEVVRPIISILHI